MTDIDFVHYYQDPLKYSPEMRDYKELWDSAYRYAAQKEFNDWYENYARLPGDICPEYRVWFWRSFGRLKWSIHMWIYRKGYKQLVRRDKWLPTLVYRILAPAFFDYSTYPTLEWTYCPYCGFTQGSDCFINCFDNDWYHFDRGGTSYVPGMPTEHWFEGTWTCPRCLKQWEYGDSD